MLEEGEGGPRGTPGLRRGSWMGRVSGLVSTATSSGRKEDRKSKGGAEKGRRQVAFPALNALGTDYGQKK